ncbi:MAG TPA: type I phosphomannose isomerase catalytic subunit [Anaerolineaceae bacterium]
MLLTPHYQRYVWGGRRLRPGGERTAEAWVVHESNLVANGPLAGHSLAEVSAQMGADLLGRRVTAHTGLRFPILIKLLDCAAWLSLQVHPDNEQALRLEGVGNFGKTEAWHILEAEAGAELLGGLRPGTTRDELVQAIRGGTLLEKMQRLAVQAGDTLFIPAGMIHALGPGLLVYEVQQVSDITYRVYDWDRPASEGRPLHLEKSIAVANAQAVGAVAPVCQLADGELRQLVTCDFFTLDVLAGELHAAAMNTGGESFHAVTVIEGQALIEGDGWQQPLARFETAVIPAACGTYRLRPVGAMKALVARA